MAGALGVRLGGRNVYRGHVENRPVMGAGRRPDAGDIRRAARLSGMVSLAALCAGVVVRVAISTRRRRLA